MKERRLRQNSLTREILFIAGAGTLLVSSLFAPNAAKLLKPLLRWRKNWEKVHKKRIYEAIGRLNRKRLVRMVQKDGQEFLEITTAGKHYLRQFQYDDIVLKHPTHWDKKWRMVIFDIPEGQKGARNVLQEKLRELGFYAFQKSVFVYPYECQDEIDFIVSCLDVNPFVFYLETSDLGQKEGTVRKFFDLV